MPVVRAESGRDHVESRDLERKGFGRGLAGGDVGQAAQAGLLGDRREHGCGKVAGHDLADERGEAVCEVSPTATDVECDCTALVGEELRDEVQIGILLLALVVLGSVLGFFSSYRSVRKYLGMSLDELY